MSFLWGCGLSLRLHRPRRLALHFQHLDLDQHRPPELLTQYRRGLLWHRVIREPLLVNVPLAERHEAQTVRPNRWCRYFDISEDWTFSYRMTSAGGLEGM